MDALPPPTIKWLAPFTDGINGVSYQILKIVSKSPSLKEANKDWQIGSNGTMLA
jgi:hypothetical protein